MLLWGAVLLVGLSGALSYRAQSFGVKGTLRCGSAPAKHARVVMFDIDYEPNGGLAEDLLDETFADPQGRFRLAAAVHKLWPLQPRIRIRHTCLRGPNSCPSTATLRLPNSYINSAKPFPLGDLNLEALVDENNDSLC